MAQPQTVYIHKVSDVYENKNGTPMQSLLIQEKGNPYLMSVNVFQIDFYKPDTVCGLSDSKPDKDNKVWPVAHPVATPAMLRKADKAIDSYVASLKNAV
jgi:hypothetical protein